MTGYVLGFAFNAGHVPHPSVALIRKKRPRWQAGHLNGIGGHIEPGEHPIQAMEREFGEETGLLVPEENWQPFCIMRGGDWSVHCFRAFDIPLWELKTMTDEEVYPLVSADRLPKDVLPNLRWLIPLALDRDEIAPVVVFYTAEAEDERAG